MLQRVLEPEVMDSPLEARDYDAMDHAEVNRRFVTDLLAAAPELHTASGTILDLGTGTAQIPIELCRQASHVRVRAVDLAEHMLALADVNVRRAGLSERIALERVDAKRLPFAKGTFAATVSNSIVHHIPQPGPVLAEAVRVTAPGGWLFVRDLLRPADDATVEQLVQTYAGGANAHQRQMFDDSLRAALSLEEIRGLAAELGFDAAPVVASSDRHWTWCARRPS